MYMQEAYTYLWQVFASKCDGHTRESHFEHGGMPCHELLNLDGRDVFAARDNDIFGTIAQIDIAVGMPDTDIAGVEPAVGEI
jgi:hypothetical protein